MHNQTVFIFNNNNLFISLFYQVFMANKEVRTRISPVYRLEFHNLSPQPVRHTYTDSPLNTKGKRLLQVLHKSQGRFVNSGFIGEDVSNDAPTYHYHLAIEVLSLSEHPRKQLEELWVKTNRAFTESGINSAPGINNSPNFAFVYLSQINTPYYQEGIKIERSITFPELHLGKPRKKSQIGEFKGSLIEALRSHKEKIERKEKIADKEKEVVHDFLMSLLYR